MELSKAWRGGRPSFVSLPTVDSDRPSWFGVQRSLDAHKFVERTKCKGLRRRRKNRRKMSPLQAPSETRRLPKDATGEEADTGQDRLAMSLFFSVNLSLLMADPGLPCMPGT